MRTPPDFGGTAMGGALRRSTWPQALAWRMERQLLDPVGGAGRRGRSRRLCGVQAQVASTRRAGHPGPPRDVRPARSVARVATVGWSRPGRCAARPSADGRGRAAPPLAAGGRTILGAPELAAFSASARRDRGAAQRRPRGARRRVHDPGGGRGGRHATRLRRRRGSPVRVGDLLKPLAWHGDLCFGPSRGNR